MLEAAIEWNQRTRAGLVIAVSERECARAATLMESQTKLLYNILAKVCAEQERNKVPRCCVSYCPTCNETVRQQCECQHVPNNMTLTAAEAKRIEQRVFSGERGEFAELNPSITERKKQAALNEWPSDKCVGMYMQCPYCDEVVLTTTKLERRRKG